ncbi:MAG: hypothetical protein AABX04_08100 [Nanoarchaeota archaeon]
MSSDYHLAWNNAIQQQRIAAHLLEVTFPLSKDPKLLLGVIYNLCGALEYALDALLLSEGITAGEGFQSKLTALKIKSSQGSKITLEDIKFMHWLQEIKVKHKQSPMEFQRGKNLVICSAEYQMQVLSVLEIKKYLKQSEELLQRLNGVINRK